MFASLSAQPLLSKSHASHRYDPALEEQSQRLRSEAWGRITPVPSRHRRNPRRQRERLDGSAALIARGPEGYLEASAVAEAVATTRPFPQQRPIARK